MNADPSGRAACPQPAASGAVRTPRPTLGPADRPARTISFRPGQVFAAVCLAAHVLSATPAEENTPPPKESPAATEPSAESLEQKWGIKVSSVFLSAGGNMVDFRYRVLDPTKAALLSNPEIKPQLTQQASGAKLSVPNTPKVGPLRQTTRQPVAGKIYFMLFANTRHQVKSGDKVTITMGDFKLENLTVD
jgi:hypothetical protein